jgi:hypothetical protein
LATTAGRAALRCGRGAVPTGSGDGNLQPIELDEPLVNPKRRKGRRRRWSFTGGGGNPRRRRWGIGARASEWVCWEGKGRRRRSSTGLNRAKGRKASGLQAAALAIDGHGHHGSVQGKGKRPHLNEDD